MNLVSTSSGPSIYRYNVQEERLYSASLDGVTGPSFIAPLCKKCSTETNNQLFAVGAGPSHDVLLVNWDGVSSKAQIDKSLFSLEANDPTSRTDFGRASPNGQFFAGTFSNDFCLHNATYSFYRRENDGRIQRLFGDTLTTTGFVFNIMARKCYHMDSCRQLLTGFDWDPKTNNICTKDIGLR